METGGDAAQRGVGGGVGGGDEQSSWPRLLQVVSVLLDPSRSRGVMLWR